MKETVAVLNKNGKNVVDSLLDLLSSVELWQPPRFGVVTPKKSVFEKSLGILSRQGLDSPAVAAYVSSQPMAASGFDFLQLDDAGLLFEGRIYSPITPSALSGQKGQNSLHCEATLQTLMQQDDGDYCFYLLKDNWVAAARDPIGVQPLYYGQTQDIAAFATNKKLLWQLGIENPQSFPSGNLCFANKDGFTFKPIKTLGFAPPKQVTLEDAAKTLQGLLEESVKRRICGLREVAVAFSGGLDSSVVAYLANKLGIKVTLLHVSLENQPETEDAWEAADVLGLPMQVYLFKDSDVEAVLPKVVGLIEEPNPIKAAIGIPFYWTAQCAVEAGFKAVLAGQGADELFGGYQRYVNQYCQDGDEKTRQTMYRDVVGIYESNLERDLKITGWHDVELRLPFASFEVAEFALSLPIECKIEQKPDTLRKLVLRKLALDLDLPEKIVQKPKKAVQYSTGINDAVKRIAKNHGESVNDYISGLFCKSKDAA